MAKIEITHCVCDRPGCSARVTDKGGRLALGCVPNNSGDIVAGVLLLRGDEGLVGEGVDLCRACAESLRSWFTAKQRRAVEP